MLEWHEYFFCETCRYKLPDLDAMPTMATHFIGTLMQAERAGWRRYAKWWFCPECVINGKYKNYCIEKEREQIYYFGWMSKEDIEKEWKGK